MASPNRFGRQQPAHNWSTANDPAGSHLSTPGAPNGFISTPHTVKHTGTPINTIDPAMLLNPSRGLTSRSAGPASQASQAQPSRNFGARGSTANATTDPQQFVFSSAGDSSLNDDILEATTPSQLSMLDRMHNLEERSNRPSKRRKQDDQSEGDEARGTKATTWSQFGKGGDVSQYLKDQRAKYRDAESRSATNARQLGHEINASLTNANPAHSSARHQNDLVDLTTETVDLTTTSNNQVSEAVDLTQEAAEGERDFYVVDGKKIFYDRNDAEEKRVLYGRIEGAKISCHTVPNPGRIITSRPDWPPMAVNLVRSANKKSLVIKALDPTGKDFGNVDPKTSLALKDFLDSPVYRLQLEARTDIRSKKPYEAPGQPSSDRITVHINVFGPRKYAVNPIGKALSQKQVWLRTPKTMPNNVDYYNPHCHDPDQAKLVKKATLASNAVALGPARSGFRQRTVEESSMEIQVLFDNLRKDEDLELLDADPNIVSELLPHQKKALAWMVQRETPIEYAPGKNSSGTLWRCRTESGNLMWHHVITGHDVKIRPDDVLGGILADVMGLGKTLSMLSLLSYTRSEALDFENNAPIVPSEQNESVNLRNVKSTLLVCPVSVITNWEDQILQHVREEGLTYYSYHGSNRKRSLEYLAQFDVILTSYSIVKSELSNKRSSGVTPLASANFFRVVLDEAHTIRTQQTQQFNACAKLQATRRWALTATPVQNRLEDLGALVRFLRVPPFREPFYFQSQIIAPFKVADPAGLQNLRLLVDSITLRRAKDIIDLPPRVDETIELGFNEDEQTWYDFFAKDAYKRLSAISASQSTQRKLSNKLYMGILQSILCLRQICAHGKDMLREQDLRLIEGQSAVNAISIEEDMRPPLDEHQAYSVFELLQDTNSANCIRCGKGAVAGELEDVEEEDELICTMMPCFQILCNSCVKPMIKETAKLSEEGHDRMCCPWCDTAWRISLFQITASGILRAQKLKEDLAKEPKKNKMIMRYEGPSTKTIQLTARLKDTALESIPLVEKGEMPIKSVVFSAWTTHLDLISIALDEAGIEYTMMVGSMSRKQRRESIDEFRQSKTCNVFLVTVGTGGLGLNLTAASRVFLMDIGFNPMAEQQAVDRVHRLGQKRDVLFTRYIMANSIEGKILGIQKKKKELATMSLQRGTQDKAEQVRARLEQLQSLFK